MDPRLIVSAIPWLRRAWKMLPPPARLPVLLVAAGVGIYFAVTGRDELKHAIEELRTGGANPGAERPGPG